MDNLLIIAGTNTGVGKTTFACTLISQLSKNHYVTAIKVVRDFNSACKLCVSVLREDEYIIMEEKSTESDMDSSKMLAAGAQKVMFIQAKGKGLQKCFDKLSTYLRTDSPIIVESDDLVEFATPGCFVLLSGDKPINSNQHWLESANIHLIGKARANLTFEDGKWVF